MSHNDLSEADHLKIQVCLQCKADPEVCETPHYTRCPYYAIYRKTGTSLPIPRALLQQTCGIPEIESDKDLGLSRLC